MYYVVQYASANGACASQNTSPAVSLILAIAVAGLRQLPPTMTSFSPPFSLLGHQLSMLRR